MSPRDIVEAGIATFESENDRYDDPKVSFVDYVPPEETVKAPAKYKLWLLVLVCVYLAEWAGSKAELNRILQRTFHLSENGTVLVSLILLVPVLMYGALDLITEFCRIKIGEHDYGVEQWLKQPRTTWTHRSNNFLLVSLRTIIGILEDGFTMFNSRRPPSVPRRFESSDADEDGDDEGNSEPSEVFCRIVCHIKPDKIEEYFHWKKRMNDRLCNSNFPGINSVVTIVNHEMDIYTTHISFSSIDTLNNYLVSPVRARLMKKLRPLLILPTIVQLRQARVLPDALTDLAHKQGDSLPDKHPMKWKVWTLSTIGLWVTLMLCNATLPFYLEQWGLSTSHPRVKAFISVGFVTFFNTYLMSPFLAMIFGDWLVRGEPTELDKLEPWRTLNDGMQSPWSKALLVLVYYGGLLIAWSAPKY